MRQLRIIVLSCLISAVFLSGCGSRREAYVSDYVAEEYDHANGEEKLFASNLCLIDKNDIGKAVDSTLRGYGAFDIDERETEIAFRANEKLYPASTTKIMTGLMALESGKLDEKVTVSKYAIESLEEGSSVCDLHVGDQLSLRDLLYGLLLESGNDAAVAIAEFLGDGSEMDFVTMMNERALTLGATHTHFVNSHGLHDADHYTTVYDLYLMFNEALKYDEFKEILATQEFNTAITSTDGSMRSVNWKPTNYYASGDAKAPKDTTILGGKTGTTDQAGSCLVLYNKDKQDAAHITIVMGAANKELLYKDMNAMLKEENKE